jgi:hypothetical protein
MLTVVRIATHILLFGVAFGVFVFGLGMGLAVNPLAGTLLWVAAGAIGQYPVFEEIVLNLAWIIKSFSRRETGVWN